MDGLDKLLDRAVRKIPAARKPQALFRTASPQLLVGRIRRIGSSSDSRLFLALILESASARLWPPELATSSGKGSTEEASAFEKLRASRPEGEASTVDFWIKARYCLHRRLMTVGGRQYNAEALLPNLTPNLIDYELQLNVVDVAVAGLATTLYYEQGALGMLYGGFGFLFSLALMSTLGETCHCVHPNGSVSQSGSWISRNATAALELKQPCREDPSQATKCARVSKVAAVELSHSVFLKQLLHSYQLNLIVELNDS
ncbi:hypothetical protein HPB51_022014 [Rhipicephalus microplus]|uniref:Uncharacterized protein n=1 Tax=Rhipicephalus microplus TaxID=6941 RepID=A0A9J6DIT3_RHIMP|nr:hypothetical protein HPB51_022014 [Rhipicephalus microplus]